MKPLLLKIRSSRTPDAARAATDDTFARGMELALAVALFLGLGWLLDRWLGTAPLFTIALAVLGVVGGMMRVKYGYDEAMRREEIARAEKLAQARSITRKVDTA